MSCTRITKFRSVFLCLLGLSSMFALQLHAQPARATQPGRGFALGYDAAHEITLNGTVQEVITKHALGSPAGLHLLISGPHGTVDAHVGPFLTGDMREALHLGLPIQIVGAMEVLHGRQYLLARQLIFGGRLVTVRSSTGLLLRQHSVRRASAKSTVEKPKSEGGAR